jgi:hypothetical protein
MSDDYIVIVPRDPRFAASLDAQERVAAVLRRLAPSAGSVDPEVSDAIRFHDAGSNFESISCPRCAAEISIDWWQERMDEDMKEDGFLLERYAAPCCGAPMTLKELVYESPQAFGRTSWTVQNANVGELAQMALQELEAAAGTPLVVVYQHL